MITKTKYCEKQNDPKKFGASSSSLELYRQKKITYLSLPPSLPIRRKTNNRWAKNKIRNTPHLQNASHGSGHARVERKVSSEGDQQSPRRGGHDNRATLLLRKKEEKKKAREKSCLPLMIVVVDIHCV